MVLHAFGERAVLKLMYAALIRAAERWRGLNVTTLDNVSCRLSEMDSTAPMPRELPPPRAPTSPLPPTRLSSKPRT